eukprot:14511148-Alexandrium_andersonii.AAC.1
MTTREIRADGARGRRLYPCSHLGEGAAAGEGSRSWPEEGSARVRAPGGTQTLDSHGAPSGRSALD